MSDSLRQRVFRQITGVGIAAIESAFQRMQRAESERRDGEIGKSNFVHSLRNLHLDTFQLDKIFDEIDEDGSGGLSREE